MDKINREISGLAQKLSSLWSWEPVQTQIKDFCELLRKTTLLLSFVVATAGLLSSSCLMREKRLEICQQQ